MTLKSSGVVGALAKFKFSHSAKIAILSVDFTVLAMVLLLTVLH